MEEQRTPEILLRYQQHIRAFLTSVGDCPVGTITSEKLSIYKRHVLDRGLSAATMATMLSGLRSSLRSLRDMCGLTTPLSVESSTAMLREREQWALARCAQP